MVGYERVDELRYSIIEIVCCYLFLLVVLFVALLLNITLAIINQHMLIEATNDVDTT